MTRAQFLNDLYRRLAGNGMNTVQAEQHLTYYAEMLADRMEEGMSEDAAVASMEDVDVIARRILEEEGITYYPPEAIVPSVERKQTYQAPPKQKQRNKRKWVQAALWGLAIVLAMGAASRMFIGRNVRHNNAPTDTTSVAVEEVAPVPYPEMYAEEMAPYAEEYYQNLPYEYGYGYNSGTSFTINSSLKKLKIEWASGMVYVQGWNEDAIQIDEYSRTGLNERNMMFVEEKSDELVIHYRNGTSLGNVKGDKWLTVLVPDGILEELEIETTSAGVWLYGLEQGELDVSTASGNIDLMGCYLRKAELETISGDMNLNTAYMDELDISSTSGEIYGDAYCTDVEAETISGNVNLTTWENTKNVKISTTSGDVWCHTSNTAMQSFSVDTTSGDVSLGLPYEMGFTLEYSTASGDLSYNGFDFDMSQRDGKMVYNGGGCEIKVDTTSGDLELY